MVRGQVLFLVLSVCALVTFGGCHERNIRDISCSADRPCLLGFVCCDGTCRRRCAEERRFAGEMEWATAVRGRGFETVSSVRLAGMGGEAFVLGSLAGQSGGRASLDAPGEVGVQYIEKPGQEESFYLARYRGDGRPDWAAVPLPPGTWSQATASAGLSQEPGGAHRWQSLIAGRYAGVFPSPGTNGQSAPDMGAFVAQIDAGGELVWARKATFRGTILALDALSPALGSGADGFFAGGIIEDGEEHSEQSVSSVMECPEMFLARYDGEGQEKWTETGNGCAVLLGLAVPDRDSVVGLGYFEDTLILGNRENTRALDASGGRGLFLAKYVDTSKISPRLAWVRQVQGGEEALPIVVSSSLAGTVTLAARVFGNAVLETEGESLVLTAGEDARFQRILLARYLEDGRLKWAKLVAGRGNLTVRDLAVGDDGRFLVVGEFAGQVTFGIRDGEEYTLIPVGKRDVFVAYYDAEGQVIWARREGGYLDGERANAVSFSGAGSAVVGGTFAGRVTFARGGKNEKTLVSAGHEDGFLLKLRLSREDGSGAFEQEVPGSAGTICTARDPFDSRACRNLQSSGCVWYVNGKQSQSGDGSAWEAAFRTVQEAIDSAHCAFLKGGNCEALEVWVAAETYHVYQRCREDTLWMRPGVSVFGGFVGREDLREQRDPERNQTVLDGSDGVSPEHRVYHVVTGCDHARLDGFTIQGGRADGDGSSGQRLGGGVIAYGTSPTITQSVFRDNYASFAGGGMGVLDGNPVLGDVVFEHNEAGEHGGGFFSRGGSLRVIDAVFESNGAGDSGGGIRVEDPEFYLSLSNSRFLGNRAGVQGGGGVLYSVYHGRLERTIFEKNQLDGDRSRGGGLAIVGGRVKMDDCRFFENTSKGSGGGLALIFSQSSVERSLFRDNLAAGEGGGGVFSVSCQGEIISSRFSANEAGYRGGGFFGQDDFTRIVSSLFAGNSAETGGALTLSAGEVVNCTITANTARMGAGGVLFLDGAAGGDGYSYSSMVNTISRDNQPYDNGYGYSFLLDEVSVQYSNIGRINTLGHHNFGLPPKFVDAEKGNYRLQSDSPCIDAADSDRAPALDMEGNPRWDAPTHGDVRGHADMGAYEYQPAERSLD